MKKVRILELWLGKYGDKKIKITNCGKCLYYGCFASPVCWITGKDLESKNCEPPDWCPLPKEEE